MPEPQAAWLLEPHVQHFFRDFPLPLALMREDGGIAALNARFTESFEGASLESGSLQALIRALDAAADRTASKVALDALLEHVARHFADEEIILERKGYAHLETHKRAHAGLLARAARLKQKAEAEEIPLGELVEFLAHDVVARHLLTADRDFFPLFAAPAAAASAS